MRQIWTTKVDDKPRNLLNRAGLRRIRPSPSPTITLFQSPASCADEVLSPNPRLRSPFPGSLQFAAIPIEPCGCKVPTFSSPIGLYKSVRCVPRASCSLWIMFAIVMKETIPELVGERADFSVGESVYSCICVRFARVVRVNVHVDVHGHSPRARMRSG